MENLKTLKTIQNKNTEWIFVENSNMYTLGENCFRLLNTLTKYTYYAFIDIQITNFTLTENGGNKYVSEPAWQPTQWPFPA
jgi:hypothetical protein